MVRNFDDFSKKLEETSGRAASAYSRTRWNMAVSLVDQVLFSDSDVETIEKAAKDSGYDPAISKLAKEVYDEFKEALKNMRK